MRELFIKWFYTLDQETRDYLKWLYYGDNENLILSDSTFLETVEEAWMFKFYEFVEYVQEQLEN